MVRVWRARWKGVREEPASLRPSIRRPAQTWWIRAGRGASRCQWAAGTLWAGSLTCKGGHGEGLRRTHGEAAGTESGSSSTQRIGVNTGTARSHFPKAGSRLVDRDRRTDR